MSLISMSSGLLTIAPKMIRSEHQLYARAHMALQMFSFFSWNKELWVDAQRRKLKLHKRYLWFLGSSQVIPFERVAWIETDYKSMGTSWGYELERTDEMDRFLVGLKLKDPDETVPLFSFTGEGSVQTGLRGMILSGDSMVDWSGTQGDAFAEFVFHLRQLLEVPVGEPLAHLPDQQGNRFVCSACGRNAPPNPNKKKCLYCGGDVVLHEG